MTTKIRYPFHGTAHFTFVWTIESGSALLVTEYLKSPTFNVQSMGNTKWKLMLYKRFKGRSMHLGIQRAEDNGPDHIEIEFELSILGADGSTLKMNRFMKEFTATEFECWLSILQDRDKIFFQKNSEFLPNDTFTVRCRIWLTGTEILKPETCFARTRLEVDRRSFIWEINEFKKLHRAQERTHYLYPSLIGFPELILSFFLSESNVKNYINIKIDQNLAIMNHYMFCKFSLLDNERKAVHSREIQSIILLNQQNVYTFEEFFEKDELMKDKSFLLQNDILRLKCEFCIQGKPAWSRIESCSFSDFEDMTKTTSETLEMHNSKPDESFNVCCPFKKAFKDLYRNKSLSDVKLRTDTKSFPAHKMILSIRSSVFEAMFTQDMREKTSKIVDIPDLDADTLGRLLLYIYKDTVEELQWESAMDLFRAADKYQLWNLRKKCSFLLKSNLTVTNVCSILLLADMHQDSALRKVAEDFILQNETEVFDSDEWKIFKEENLRVALEIMERIVHLMKRKNPSN